MRVLLARVCEAFRSKDVEFMARVLLENHVPICPSGKKNKNKIKHMKKSIINISPHDPKLSTVIIVQD